MNKTYHDKHRCAHCSYRYEEHAGENNPDCPPARCPKSDKFPPITDNEQATTDRLRRYWTARTTTFRPI